MSTYIHFTEEQKQRAAAVDLEEFLRFRGEKLIPSGREKRLAKDHSVTVRGNEWYEEARRSLERIHYEVDYVITHCAPSSIVDILGNGGYVHDHLTDFLEEIRERAKFHYWLFGHYHDNRIIDNRFVLLWEQMVQVV